MDLLSGFADYVGTIQDPVSPASRPWSAPIFQSFDSVVHRLFGPNDRPRPRVWWINLFAVLREAVAGIMADDQTR